MIRITRYFVLAFICSCLRLTAQPLDGSILWLRADKGITDSNGRVIIWRNQSDTTQFAYQFTPVNRPIYVVESLHGMPTVRFNGFAQFMDAPSVFPRLKDYTLCYVVRLNSFGSGNNMIGGNGHTVYFSPPLTNHGNFNTSAQSSIPLVIQEPAIVTITYRQTNKTAQIYINGQRGDSTYIGDNGDSTIQLGSFQYGNYLMGDIAEVLLYEYECSGNERERLEQYLFDKYTIPKPVVAHPLHEIFTEIPQDLQFYAREANDSSVVRLKGVMTDSRFDSIVVQIKKNDRVFRILTAPLNFSQGSAPFEFVPKIHAELSEYSFDIYARNAVGDSLLASRRDIVCGDVFVVSGQSNSIQGTLQSTYRNEFCRTFGINASSNPNDTLWELSTALTRGGSTNVGAWGLRLQQLLKESYNIPICLINGGKVSTSIEQHLPNPTNDTDLTSLYGSLYYRIQKAKLQKAVKAIIWYQGESNIDMYYLDNYRKLYNSWQKDYPAIQKIYVAQIRPGCDAGGNQGTLREVQRNFTTEFPNTEVVATNALPGHEECHFNYEGYQAFASNLFRLIARDIYHSNDTIAISSPNIKRAFFTDSTNTELALLFSPPGTMMFTQNEYPYSSVTGRMKDCFFTNNKDSILRVTTSQDTIYLRFKSRSTSNVITYLPGTYYTGTNVTYEGPWLVNQRGIGALSFYEFPLSKRVMGGIKNNDGDTQFSINITPNPTTGDCIAEFSTQIDGKVTLKLVSLTNGLDAAQIFNGMLKSGEHTILISKAGLTSGAYILRLEAPNQRISQKMIILH